MNPSNQPQDPNRFNIIFEKLEEAKKEQDGNLMLELAAVSETNQTIALFKEFQESIVESSCTTFTKS